MADDNGKESRQVSVTWKWTTVVLCAVCGFFAVADRTGFDRRVTKLEEMVAPMHDAIIILPAKMDVISEQLNNLQRESSAVQKRNERKDKSPDQ